MRHDVTCIQPVQIFGPFQQFVHFMLGPATVALAVNAIPRVLAAPPGLHAMADLPVPAAMLGDARKLVERK